MPNKKKRKPSSYAQDMYEERKYGFYWYAALWKIARTVLIFSSALVILIGIIYTGWQKIDSLFFAPVNPEDKTEIIFTVSSGASLSSVSKELEKSQLIHNSAVFKYMADFKGAGQRIQSGQYTLNRSMSAEQILSQLVSGDGKPNTMRITIIPGWTIEDTAEYLVKSGVFRSSDDFLNRCKTAEDYKEYDFIDDVLSSNRVQGRKYVLEGYLSPNTYEIYTGADADSIIRKLLTQTSATLGMSMDEIFTLASMIEKEAKTADFAKVSAVFHNRLKLNMTLGSDATVKYESGSQKMSLDENDLAEDSLYNTYLYRGLPIGPICNPSMDAVVAALYPDEQFVAQKYLYFCSTDPNSGELHFSRTLEEHNAAVAMYRPLWEEYDKSRGL